MVSLPIQTRPHSRHFGKTFVELLVKQIVTASYSAANALELLIPVLVALSSFHVLHL